ncbi:MAG: hypothetical protein QOC81_528 [Thermoanaerobaculia bacterium]|jgi:hypothetical protein|nr:hypothetical protein [Thermoanaerobaculia bacterium]
MTMAPSKANVILFSLLLLFAANINAQSDRPVRPNGPGTGIPDDDRVPWKFVEKGAPIEKTSLTLYWLPSSQKELERSELVSSRALIQAGLRCVAFRIVLPDNAATTQLLGATGTLPTALLVNDQGTVIRHIVDRRPMLPPASVEGMVHDELAARDEAMYRNMSDARKHAKAGENDAAIALYKSVWNDRCFFPMAGLEAQRGLKALGVEVHDVPTPGAVDPQLKKPLTVKPDAPKH